ncbi:type II toxin-antitoxin system RelE family toxin [Spirosoma koreense]
MKGQKDSYRIRIGDYRVIYTIDDGILTITIVAIGDRKDIYS